MRKNLVLSTLISDISFMSSRHKSVLPYYAQFLTAAFVPFLISPRMNRRYPGKLYSSAILWIFSRTFDTYHGRASLMVTAMVSFHLYNARTHSLGGLAVVGMMEKRLGKLFAKLD